MSPHYCVRTVWGEWWQQVGTANNLKLWFLQFGSLWGWSRLWRDESMKLTEVELDNWCPVGWSSLQGLCEIFVCVCVQLFCLCDLWDTDRHTHIYIRKDSILMQPRAKSRMEYRHHSMNITRNYIIKLVGWVFKLHFFKSTTCVTFIFKQNSWTEREKNRILKNRSEGCHDISL